MMKNLVTALGAVLLSVPAVASAQQPGHPGGAGLPPSTAPSPERPEFTLPPLSGETSADEAALMYYYWRMEIERELLTNPQAQIHARAAREAAHREARLEARRWWGHSASRPTVLIGGAPSYSWWWPHGYVPLWHGYAWSAYPEPYPYQGSPTTPYDTAF